MITTILVGNGIGMAIDSQHFKLECGINAITNKLTADERKIVCFNNGIVPHSEEELEDHHKVLSACSQLIEYEPSLDCLNETGRKFPSVYQNFIYQVAKHFYDYNIDPQNEEFNSFIDNLIKFIQSLNRCHIATLNYDKLLYKSLIEKDILKGYDGCLVDGIHKYSQGFKPENLIPLYKNNFGWYMHLHGSPAFQTQFDGTINKCSPNELPENLCNNNLTHNHIVLAHTKLKPYIIANSSLLDCYFNFFIKAISESDTLILFGYSGYDEHINLEIKKRLSGTDSEFFNIKIIEWHSSVNQDERQTFWESKLYPDGHKKQSMQLKLMDNILKYDFM